MAHDRSVIPARLFVEIGFLEEKLRVVSGDVRFRDTCAAAYRWGLSSLPRLPHHQEVRHGDMINNSVLAESHASTLVAAKHSAMPRWPDRGRTCYGFRLSANGCAGAYAGKMAGRAVSARCIPSRGRRRKYRSFCKSLLLLRKRANSLAIHARLVHP